MTTRWREEGTRSFPLPRFRRRKIVSPTNGPASRRLAAAIQQHLITRNPYRAHHVTTAQVFSSGSNRVHEDLYVLSDQVWGWNSAYSTLRDAALEGIQAHPTTYVSGVVDTIWQQLSTPIYSSRGQHTPGASASRIAVTGVRLPVQDKGELIPPGEKAWISRPDQSIREVWTSPTTHKFIVPEPKERARFDQIIHDLKTLESRFPHRVGNHWLQHRLNQVAHWYPPPIFWLVLGLVAFAIRRPRGTEALALLVISALTVIVLNALGQTAEPRYMLPVAPAFILLGAAALLGRPRSRQSSQARVQKKTFSSGTSA